MEKRLKGSPVITSPLTSFPAHPEKRWTLSSLLDSFFMQVVLKTPSSCLPIIRDAAGFLLYHLFSRGSVLPAWISVAEIITGSCSLTELRIEYCQEKISSVFHFHFHISFNNACMQPRHNLIMPRCYWFEGKRGVKSSLVVKRWRAEDPYRKEMSCFLSAFCDSCVDSELGGCRLLFPRTQQSMFEGSAHAGLWASCPSGSACQSTRGKLQGEARHDKACSCVVWHKSIAQAQTCGALTSNFSWETAEVLWRGTRKKGVSTGCRDKEKSIEMPLGVSPPYKKKIPKSQCWDCDGLGQRLETGRPVTALRADACKQHLSLKGAVYTGSLGQ